MPPQFWRIEYARPNGSFKILSRKTIPARRATIPARYHHGLLIYMGYGRYPYHHDSNSLTQPRFGGVFFRLNFLIPVVCSAERLSSPALDTSSMFCGAPLTRLGIA
jgi:hypothetical protein